MDMFLLSTFPSQFCNFHPAIQSITLEYGGRVYLCVSSPHVDMTVVAKDIDIGLKSLVVKLVRK